LIAVDSSFIIQDVFTFASWIKKKSFLGCGRNKPPYGRSYVRSPVFFALPSSSPCYRLHLAVESPCCRVTLLSSLHLAADGPASRLPRNRRRTDPRVFLIGRTVVVVAIFLSVTRVRPRKSLARVSPSLLNASTALSYCYSFHSRPSHCIANLHPTVGSIPPRAFL
jgi:hypothetical protein